MPTKVEKSAAPASEANDTQRKLTAPPAGAVEVDGGDVEEVLKFDEGEAFEAVYRGSKTIKAKPPQKEDSVLHAFKWDDGVMRGVWGTFSLNEKLEKIESGTRVWVCYDGKGTIASGNTMHNWRVFRVNTAAAANAANKLPFDK